MTANFMTTWASENMSRRLSLYSGLLGRVGVATLFIGSAHYHLTVGWDMTMNEMMASGVPFPQPALWLGMFISSGAALAFLIGIQEVWAARILAVYSLVVSYVIDHPFATAVPTGLNFVVKDFDILMGTVPPKNLVAFISFMKDCAIAGSLLAYASLVEASIRAKHTKASTDPVDAALTGFPTHATNAH